MKKIIFTPTLLVIAALLTACNSMPTNTSMLDQTRNDYRSAQSNPKVASYAPLEMKQASDAMAKANAAAANNDSTEEIDKLAYLAKQKIALTQEVAKQKSAEADVAKSGTERDKMRLDQRTREADQSRTAANIARGDAAYAQQQHVGQRPQGRHHQRAEEPEADLCRGVDVGVVPERAGVVEVKLVVEGAARRDRRPAR